MTAGEVRKVLVIDDDPDIRALADVALSELGGLTTIICRNGEEALAKIQTDAPDAVLLDLFFPGGGGVELLGTLRAHAETCHLPVIILTAESNQSEFDPLRALQISGVIRKPFNPETLADDVKRLCACG